MAETAGRKGQGAHGVGMFFLCGLILLLTLGQILLVQARPAQAASMIGVVASDDEGLQATAGEQPGLRPRVCALTLRDDAAADDDTLPVVPVLDPVPVPVCAAPVAPEAAPVGLPGSATRICLSGCDPPV